MKQSSISLAPPALLPVFELRPSLDTRYYEAGVKISDEEMKQISLRTHSTNPEWNYTISPRGRPILKVKLIVW